MTDPIHWAFAGAGGVTALLAAWVLARIAIHQIKVWMEGQFHALQPVQKKDLQAALMEHEDVERRMNASMYEQFKVLVDEHHRNSLDEMEKARRLAVQVAGRYDDVLKGIGGLTKRVEKLEQVNGGGDREN